MLQTTPISGPLPDGATIALQAATRFKEPSRMVGVEAFGPAYVGLTDYRWNSVQPFAPYLDAKDAALTANNIFTVTVLPQPSIEVRASWSLYQCQIVVLKAANGKYVAHTTGDEALTATAASLEGAGLLILNLDDPYNFYWCGYTYADRAVLQLRMQLSRGGIDFCKGNGGATLFMMRQTGAESPAGFFTPFLVTSSGRPEAPTNVRVDR
jgi:hypothetical protein